ncbi:MAG: N-acetyltransferase [Burkholderiaceae bacterium]|nr:N-acetyltransferase [Burkholderiaceae bacterium]
MKAVTEGAPDYVIRVFDDPAGIDAAAWDALLLAQAAPSPFMRHAYLSALHASGSATTATGWAPHFVTLWQGHVLVAACPLYVKDHSYGEYVFDWAWANAYAQHGLDYYPKAVAAVPFTPVPGARLLACDAAARAALVAAVVQFCGEASLSSLHLLFGADDDIAACAQAGLMLRHTVQFHWSNLSAPMPPEGELAAVERPGGGSGYRDFDHFLATLSQEKRKKIRQERRKVREAGVSFRWARGADITGDDWDFFYRCYERTYLEHGNAPYLTRDFFHRMQQAMPENWLLFIAEHEAGAGPEPIASSLIALGHDADGALACYGRYWGALARVDCLHFEACYYRPIEWCIDHGAVRFEGGAQGEHKMARALMPVKTTSAHWLAHPAFADAVERFLEREGAGIGNYLEHLEGRSPFRRAD